MLEPKYMPVEFDQSEKPFLIYSNSTEMGITIWDIRIKLMSIFDKRDDKAIIRNHGTVIMTPAHAKAMLRALEETVQLYEAKFGPIDLARTKKPQQRQR